MVSVPWYSLGTNAASRCLDQRRRPDPGNAQPLTTQQGSSTPRLGEEDQPAAVLIAPPGVRNLGEGDLLDADPELAAGRPVDELGQGQP